MKNLEEKGVWAYPGTAHFFSRPTPIISGTDKAIRTSNFVLTFTGPIGKKSI